MCYKNNSNKGNGGKVDEKKKNPSQSSDQQNQNKGESILKQNSVEKCKNNFIVECNLLNTEDVYTTTGKSNLGRCVTKFLADSGATEHLTKSRLIFKTLDELKCGEIRCANKNNSANLKTEGVGKIEISLKNGKSLEIDQVIFTNALKENLLSLRKFAKMGLAIYLDNKRIDIFDPVSNEHFISDVYKRPYWIVDLEINTNNATDKNRSVIINRRIFANLAKGELPENKCHAKRYSQITRFDIKTVYSAV